MNEKKTYQTEFGGKTLTFETGVLARRADSAIRVQYGETVVLVTAVVAKEPREGVDFLPLLIDYEERMYAAGKISGSRFIKREGRPSETAILNARLIDRPIRPLFPKGFNNDIQIIATVLAMDGENDPDIPAMIGASAALMITDAPFEGPIAGARIGLINDQFVVNPTFSEQNQSELDLVVSATASRVMMLEAGVNQLSEEKILEAIKFAQDSMKPVFELINQMTKELKPERKTYEKVESEVANQVKEFASSGIAEALAKDAIEQKNLLDELLHKTLHNFEGTYKQSEIASHFKTLVEKESRNLILHQGKRPDGRAHDEIRQISTDISVIPRTHGSGLFTRGETQVMSVVTLGGPGEEQMIDVMEGEDQKRFMHHYNFPPYSVGEVSPLRGTSRREIGHGALAERAVVPVIPAKEEFPYIIRVVSEVLASNGSSSMASTCGTILALMDAGVPIKTPVAGIAIGLVTAPEYNDDENGHYQLLTDIQGIEDFGGDMDFKVTGTVNGITAIQLDIKVKGLTHKIIEESLQRAKVARMQILEKMTALIDAPRTELSPYAPRVISLKVDPKKIGEIIGPGGKNINTIIDKAGGKEVTSINIDQDGLVSITSHDAAKAQIAKQIIEDMTVEVEIGKVYQGKVVSIQKDRNSGKEIGAIVEFLGGKDGMVHISQISDERIADVSSKIKVGDEVKVKVVAIDPDRGRISLSMKGID